jgi:hypothetical protein
MTQFQDFTKRAQRKWTSVIGGRSDKVAKQSFAGNLRSQGLRLGTRKKGGMRYAFPPYGYSEEEHI